MRNLVSFSDEFPPKVWILGHRVHHVWFALAWALTDVRDYKVWVSDLRKHVER